MRSATPRGPISRRGDRYSPLKFTVSVGHVLTLLRSRAGTLSTTRLRGTLRVSLALSAVPFALARGQSAVSAGERSHIAPIQCGRVARPADVPMLSWSRGPVEWSFWSVSVGSPLLRVRMVVARFDPHTVRLALELKPDGDAMVSWSLSDAPSDALIALNAGQFTDAGPWGWVVHRGREWQAPGRGVLAGALVIDSAGTATVIDASEVASVRATGRVLEAVQSYPTLLAANGAAPELVCAEGQRNALVDRTHRDTRLAAGILADGRVLVVLSQFAGAGALGARLPIGPTTAEMAEIVRRLGAVRALMLDGGLSAQLSVRADSVLRWPGLRGVPLALIGRARSPK